MEDETVTVGGENEGDIEGGSVFETLLHAVADAVVVVLGFDKGDGDVGLVIEDAVGAFGFAARNKLSTNDDPPLGEADLLANLGHLIPTSLLYGGDDELCTDVAFSEEFLVHGELTVPDLDM